MEDSIFLKERLSTNETEGRRGSMPTKLEQKFWREGFFKKIEDFPTSNGITTLHMGDFSFNQPHEEAEDQHRRIMCLLETSALHRLVPEHSSKIHSPTEDRGMEYHWGDGLVAFPFQGKAVLACPTGDCPIVIMTNEQRDFGAIMHCGWKSISSGIIPQMLDMIKCIHPLENVKAGIFPGICVGCYEVKPGFAGGYFDDYILPNSKLNLKKVILEEMISEGLEAKNIQIYNYCSAHEIKDGEYVFYSHRRDGDGRRNLAFMVL